MKLKHCILALALLGIMNANATEITVNHVGPGKLTAELATALGNKNATDDDNLRALVNKDITRVNIVSTPDEDNDGTMDITDFRAIRVAFGTSNKARSGLVTLDLSKVALNEAKSLPSGDYGDIYKGILSQMVTLQEVYLPEDLEILTYATFAACPELTTVHFPQTLRIIRERAFVRCTKLAIDALPNSLEEINNYAFCDFTNSSNHNDCANVKLTELPENLRIIGDYALAYTGSTFAELPEGLEYIGQEAVRNTNISVSLIPNGLKFQQTNFLGKPQADKASTGAFVNCSSMTNIVLPEDLSVIPDKTFYVGGVAGRKVTCRRTTPPTAKDDDSNYYGSFGQLAQVNATTLYVLRDAMDEYKAQAPWSKMIMKPICQDIEVYFDADATAAISPMPGAPDDMTCVANNDKYTLEEGQNYILSLTQNNPNKTITKVTYGDTDLDPYTEEMAVANVGDVSKFILPVKNIPDQKVFVTYSDGTTTDIDNVAVEDNAPVEYYNLQGIRVNNPVNGIFIMRQGNKTTKVIK